jgi:hypothetical protein
MAHRQSGGYKEEPGVAVANDHVSTPLSVSASVLWCPCVHGRILHFRTRTRSRDASHAFFAQVRNLFPFGPDGRDDGWRTTRCGFDAFQKFTSKAVRTRGRVSTISQARFKVNQGACTRQGPHLLPNPTRARQPGRAQTSSALTRLTVKLSRTCLLFGGGACERLFCVLHRWVRRTVWLPSPAREGLSTAHSRKVCSDRPALSEKGR